MTVKPEVAQQNATIKKQDLAKIAQDTVATTSQGWWGTLPSWVMEQLVVLRRDGIEVPTGMTDDEGNPVYQRHDLTPKRTMDLLKKAGFVGVTKHTVDSLLAEVDRRVSLAS